MHAMGRHMPEGLGGAGKAMDVVLVPQMQGKADESDVQKRGRLPGYIVNCTSRQKQNR
jgi:hypothetical protein